MAKWEYQNVQFKTVRSFTGWTSISQTDLDTLQQLQDDGWEVVRVVNIMGSVGFTAHVLFMLRRESQE